MAEPLLRKTFSRLRGREKLPRKKSDAKERGEREGGGEEGAPNPARLGRGSQGPKEGPLRGQEKPRGNPRRVGVGGGGRQGS